MSCTKEDLISFLNTLEDGSEVYIDNGGLTLVPMFTDDRNVTHTAYYEVGGKSEDEG